MLTSTNPAGFLSSAQIARFHQMTSEVAKEKVALVASTMDIDPEAAVKEYFAVRAGWEKENAEKILRAQRDEFARLHDALPVELLEDRVDLVQKAKDYGINLRVDIGIQRIQDENDATKFIEQPSVVVRFLVPSAQATKATGAQAALGQAVAAAGTRTKTSNINWFRQDDGTEVKVEGNMTSFLKTNFPDSAAVAKIAEYQAKNDLYESSGGTQGSKSKLGWFQATMADPVLKGRFRQEAKA
jgi:hypothetical protein